MASSFIQQDTGLTHIFNERDFSIAYWKSYPQTRALAGGRGASYKIEIDQRQWVLRHYIRGGLVASLLKDRYLWTGMDNCRPVCERLAIQRALDFELPVAAVAAVLINRQGLFYRAAIISQFIENQGTLATFLSTKNLDHAAWNRLGGVIKKLHQAGINHADLNANNILIDEQMNFHIIDFDKAQIMNSAGDWGKTNLNRLLRSLNKINGEKTERNQPFYFTDNDWNSLIEGYR